MCLIPPPCGHSDFLTVKLIAKSHLFSLHSTLWSLLWAFHVGRIAGIWGRSSVFLDVDSEDFHRPKDVLNPLVHSSNSDGNVKGENLLDISPSHSWVSPLVMKLNCQDCFHLERVWLWGTDFFFSLVTKPTKYKCFLFFVKKLLLLYQKDDPGAALLRGEGGISHPIPPWAGDVTKGLSWHSCLAMPRLAWDWGQ